MISGSHLLEGSFPQDLTPRDHGARPPCIKLMLTLRLAPARTVGMVSWLERLKRSLQGSRTLPGMQVLAAPSSQPQVKNKEVSTLLISDQTLLKCGWGWVVKIELECHVNKEFLRIYLGWFVLAESQKERGNIHSYIPSPHKWDWTRAC